MRLPTTAVGLGGSAMAGPLVPAVAMLVKASTSASLMRMRMFTTSIDYR
jgi:hypothetical protein